MSAPPPTSRTLLHRLGDSADGVAWQQFVDLYEPLIYGVARARGLQEHDARDVVQDVLLTISKRIDRFEHRGDGSFRAWLSTIARRRVIDRVRKFEVTPRGGTSMLGQLGELVGRDESIDEAFDRIRRDEILRRAIDRVRESVSAKVWEIFRRTAIEREPAARVAADLNMQAGAVYVSRCRTQAMLKRFAGEIDRLESEPLESEPLETKPVRGGHAT